MNDKIYGLESFDQADARIIPDRSRRQAALVTGNFRASLLILNNELVILSEPGSPATGPSRWGGEAEDLRLFFCLSFPSINRKALSRVKTGVDLR